MRTRCQRSATESALLTLFAITNDQSLYSGQTTHGHPIIRCGHETFRLDVLITSKDSGSS